jgi:hypothetical protein
MRYIRDYASERLPPLSELFESRVGYRYFATLLLCYMYREGRFHLCLHSEQIGP